MTLGAGTRLGPYEILSALGAGGMGEVYRARDTRLDRTVAIKVVLGLDSADRELRERFEREAKIVASLDHPHICPVHDVGRARPTRPDGGAPAAETAEVDFLVMPLLDGQTLFDRLKSGALAFDQAIEIARQIADALDRAHRHGVVHRDLKPANVMLTKTGARLLDFGLARLDPPVSDAASVVTRPALTSIGAVMGTVPYMPPEQLSGVGADARSDIWAFGCVLYEMLSGRRPFAGESDAALVGAIMAATPAPISQVAPGLPHGANLDRLLAGALAKDREERWQSMRDVKRALAMVTSESREGTPARVAQARGWPMTAIALVTAASLVAAWLGWKALQPTPAPALVRFDVTPVGTSVIQTTTDTYPYLAVSPDGRAIAFVATTGTTGEIWIKRLDRTAERLPDTIGGTAPFWSPDSQSIAFLAGASLKRKDLAGGTARVICAASAAGTTGTWSPSGEILFNEWGQRRLVRVSANGGTPVVVREGKVSYGFPSFLPDGRHFLYTVPALANGVSSAFVGSLDSPEDTPVPGVESQTAFAAGHLLFWKDGSLVAQPFDLRSFQLGGQPIAIAEELHTFVSTGFAAFSASPDLLVYQAGLVARRIVVADRQGLDVSTIGPTGWFSSVRVSRDGSRIAFNVRDQRLGSNDIFIYEVARDLTRKLTSDRGTENVPTWTPDGKTVVYAADRSGPPSLFARDAEGVGQEVVVVAPSAFGPQSPGSVTPDGRSIVFVQAQAQTGYDIAMAPLDHGAAPVILAATRGRESSPRVSPDGKWLAFQSTESGRSEVYVQPLTDPNGRRRVSGDGGVEPRWHPDGKELYFAGGLERNDVRVVDFVSTATTIEPRPARVLFTRQARFVDYDVMRDGKFLIVVADPVSERGTLSAVTNWRQLLKR
jgi:Tol biopolymer transport system component